MAEVGSRHIKVLTLEDILEHKLLTLSKASRARPVDPKHADDVYRLGSLLGRSNPEIAQEHLVKEVYGIEDLHCERCLLSSNPLFPLAPKREIFRLLGWTCVADINVGTVLPSHGVA
jgi:hypothetical protein